jgi:hypothetical protein
MNKCKCVKDYYTLENLVLFITEISVKPDINKGELCDYEITQAYIRVHATSGIYAIVENDYDSHFIDLNDYRYEKLLELYE